MIQGLITLLESFDQTVGFSNLSTVQPLAHGVRAEAETLVDYIFLRLLILALVLVCGLMGAVLIYGQVRERSTNPGKSHA